MLEIKPHRSISDINPSVWRDLQPNDYPFLQYEFLQALEQSGSVSEESGWQPCHLELIEQGETVLLLPLYVKYHSWGEYVFDHSWADAFQQSGLNYYPKLLSAIPFTPAAGPRWLSKMNHEEALSKVLMAIKQFANEYSLESWHLLFPDMPSFNPDPSLVERTGVQYQWFNRQYQSFDHFLEGLTSRKRKEIKKERAKSSAFTFKHLDGSSITPSQCQQFYELYSLTYLKRGRNPYLDEHFFKVLVETMPHQMLFVLAYLDDTLVAGALSFHDASTLYGRYWGCYEEYDSLHFETCYYQGIDYCIANKLDRFDSGAQGEHKIKRGFEPVSTRSIHWIANPSFKEAIAGFCRKEKQYIEEQKLRLAELLPFKKDQN